jgi:hypothetical protein
VHSFEAKRTEPVELSWINSSSSCPWPYLDQRTWQLEPSVHQLPARTLTWREGTVRGWPGLPGTHHGRRRDGRRSPPWPRCGSRIWRKQSDTKAGTPSINKRNYANQTTRFGGLRAIPMVPARSGTRVGGAGRHQILSAGHLRGSSGVGRSGGGADGKVMSPSCRTGRCSSTSSHGSRWRRWIRWGWGPGTRRWQWRWNRWRMRTEHGECVVLTTAVSWNVEEAETGAREREGV